MAATKATKIVVYQDLAQLSIDRDIGIAVTSLCLGVRILESGFKMFIHSTMEDLPLERQKIWETVTKSENIPIMSEHIIDVENSPRKTLEDKVDQCDAYIGVFHKK